MPSRRLSHTRRAKFIFLLVVLVVATWIFNTDARNCLSRDFTPTPAKAICWRATNDYESTINVSGLVLNVLVVMLIISASVFGTRNLAKRPSISKADNAKMFGFLSILSVVILVSIASIIGIYTKTTFNNNNYFLNSMNDIAFYWGIPLWIAVTSSAATYGFCARQQKTR